jgi:START domain-containing protein
MNKSSMGPWLISFLISLGSYAQDNCSLKKDDEGIKVYLCDSETSNFKIIQVELDVPATISQYAATVIDIDQYHEWQYKIIGIKTLKKISNTELYYYSEVHTPWPTANRDFIFHLQMRQDPETKVLTVELTEIPDYLPEKDGIVRIPQAHSILTVTPIDKTNVHVRYVLDIDPGGEVPAWIANLFSAQAPWYTYKNLKDRIKAQGEERITVPFIEDY